MKASIWALRGIVLCWVVFVLFFFPSKEVRFFAGVLLLSPALVVLAIAEYVAARVRQRAVFAEAVSSLGFKLETGWSSTVTGVYDRCEVVIRTEASNEVGKGTCVSVRVDPPVRDFAVGPRWAASSLKKASGVKDFARGLPAPFDAVAVRAYLGPGRERVFADAEALAALGTLVAGWNGAFLGDHVAIAVQAFASRQHLEQCLQVAITAARATQRAAGAAVP